MKKPVPMKSNNFQVNLEGIISLLSSHLYSSPKVYVRELVQNSIDAITARKKLEPDLIPAIRVQFVSDDRPSLVFEDNGIGLTMDEVQEFLSSIGSSSKRENGRSSDDFIGQFGIGLLAAFMVTDEIVMITRSAKGGPAIEWRGCADGTYTVRILDDTFEPGTRVYIYAKEDSVEFCSSGRVQELLTYYCDLLPMPILFASDEANEKVINRIHAPFLEKTYFTPENENEIAEYGKEMVGGEILAAIPLSTRNGKTTGVAYIRGNTASLSSKASHKVYMKRMLLSEENSEILPDWAFFVKAVINTSELRPTASREALYQDETLSRVRAQMGRCIRDYLVELHRTNPDLLNRVIGTHRVSMKMMAKDDADFFRIIIRYLRFPGTFGEMTIPEYRECSEEILHIYDEDVYKKVRSIAQSYRIAIINSRYDSDRELLEKLGEIYEGIRVREVGVDYIMQDMEALSPEEYACIEPQMEVISEELARLRCTPEIRKFEPEEMPCLFYLDELMSLERRASQLGSQLSPLWGKLMKGVAGNSGSATLCLNYENALVRRIVELTDPEKLRHAVMLLYVQALLLGNYQLGPNELNLLAEGLTGLLSPGSGQSNIKHPEI